MTQDFQRPQPHSDQEIKEENEDGGKETSYYMDNAEERAAGENPFNRNKTIKRLGDIPETVSVVIPRKQVQKD